VASRQVALPRPGRPWAINVPLGGLAACLRELDPTAAWAALVAVVWFAFGMVPLQLAAAERFGLTPAQAAGAAFVVWGSGAVASALLAVLYRQPITITWSSPALLYLMAQAGPFTRAQLQAACLVAGLTIVALGLLGIGGKITAWLPLPLAMGMFAGSILSDVSRLVQAGATDEVVAGSAVAGYFLGTRLRRPGVPPLGVAAVSGGIAAFVVRGIGPAAVTWVAPAPTAAALDFSGPAIIAVVPTVVVLAMGLGHAQGLGFLRTQGYRVADGPATVAVGLATLASALFGGHPANVSRIGTATLAGPAAGPLAGRYRATLLTAGLMVLLGAAAGPVAALLAALPSSYVVALIGLALLPTFEDAFARAVSGPLRTGPVVAFIVAASPVAVLGLPSACWALLAGLAVSLLLEPEALRSGSGART
jgi:benzoate membrane transport protein